MRKIYTFLALCLIFIGATSAMAADGRTFKDFEINLVTTSAPTLPEGVTQISYPSYGVNYRNGDNHGTSWYAIQFDVDGPVKITLGGCEYAKDNYQWVDGHIEDAAGNVLCENVGICAAGCKGSASYEYKGGANTLKVYCGEYCPYVKVEKIDASAEPKPFGFNINLVTTSAPALPDGVTQISYPSNGVNYRNGDNHGTSWYAIQFDVPGPVKITIGGCQYIKEGYEGYVTDDKGAKLGDLKNKTEKCYHEDGSAATFEYKGGANTLKVYCGQYCPILKVEAIEATDPTVKEKTLYKTKFQDWDAVKVSDTETTIKKATTDGQELTFSLSETEVTPTGTQAKFTNECITEGYLMAAKTATPYIKTSTLANVTSVKFVHAATGSNRGWGLKVKGDGDADWVTLSSEPTLEQGKEVEVKVKRTNVQLWFYNLNPDQNAYMTSLEIKGNVKVEPRNFEDFKVDFRTNPYTVVAPKDGLPNGVKFDGGTFHDEKHGYSNVKMTVPVDGPVKFTIGTSAYTQQATVSIDGGEPTAIETLGSTDDEFGKYTKNVVYTYNEEKAATLTFDLGKYCPYFFAEACDQIPYVSVTYYNTNGKAIGEETVIGNSELKFKYSAADVTVPEGQAFRGWFNGKSVSAKKVKEGIALAEDIKLYAKATPIEVAKLGAIFNYPLNNPSFYPEDHELFNTTGVWHDKDHGFVFTLSQNFSVDVAGNAVLVLTTCKHPETKEGEQPKKATITITDAEGKTVGEPITLPIENANDGTTVPVSYNGPATTLTATVTSGNAEAYIHNVTVYNVKDVPTKNENGYYEIASGDASGFVLALQAAKEGDKIFLPNGTYDLGERVLTTISVNNVSIIGESMDNTIIRNAPDKSTESINNTATLVNTSKNLYIQDLTIQNALDYYAIGGTGRAVSLWDKGENTICKNVKMLSYQDTYYSNKASKFYWEDCELHGCVDYVCGDGDVVFNRSTFVNESRAKDKKSGSDVICAPNTTATINWGYVFLDCKISSLCNSFTFARSWGGKSKAQFIRTQILDNSLASSRFTIEGMNVAADKFKEYATTNSAGTITTPNSNVINFTHSSGNNKYETVLTDAEAAQYTVANIFGEWAPDKIAAQVTDKDKGSVFLVDGKITKNRPTSGKFRIANARGGFGPMVDTNVTTAIEAATFSTTKNAPKKFFKDNKIVIVKNGKTYNVAGQEVK